MKSTELKRACVALVALLAAYAIYVQLAVPLLEPPVKKRKSIAAADAQGGPRITDRYLTELKDLFGPEGWENRSPKVLRHRDTMLLFQDYQPQPDGTVRLQPCTVIMWREEGDPAMRADTALVLQAPDGAMLQLSKPINLRSADLGQPVAGQLTGKIRVRSRGKPDGSGRLDVSTSNVFIDAGRLYTSEAVDFSYEQHRAQGRDLLIQLLPAQSKKRPSAPKGWAGIRSIEMVHLDQLHLQVESDAKSKDDPARRPSSTPVDIVCDGPLRADFVKNVMTLEDDVQLRRGNPDGTFDQLNCERLQLNFDHAPENKSVDVADAQPAAANANDAVTKANPPESKRPLADAPKLIVTRVLAEGNPVVLDAPSRQAQVRGRRLAYDLKKGRFWLTPSERDAADRVWIRHQQTEVEARSLNCEFDTDEATQATAANAARVSRAPQIDGAADTKALSVSSTKPGMAPAQPSATGRIRSIQAEGPGRIISVPSAKTDSAPPQPIRISWQDRLVFAREKHLNRVTLSKNAIVRLGETEGIEADTLHLWLEPTPEPVAGRRIDESTDLQLRPQRLIAISEDPTTRPVILRADGVVGTVHRLDADFEHTVARATPIAAQRTQPFLTVSTSDAAPNRQRNSQRTLESAPQVVTSSDRRFDLGKRRSTGSTKTSMTRLTGESLNVVILMDAGDVTIQDLILDKRVEVAQYETRESRNASFRLNGDRIRMTPSTDGNPIVAAIGQPVEVRSDQMLLKTTGLNLDQERNLVWTKQPGQMIVLVDRDAEGKRLAVPQEATIDWANRMEFDGLRAKFMGEVEVHGPDQRLRANEVEVVLTRRINFKQGDERTGNAAVELSLVRATGNVHLNTRDVQENQMLSTTYLQAPFVQVDRTTGDLLAGGPGRVITVRDGFRQSLDFQNESTAKREGRRNGERRVARDGTPTTRQPTTGTRAVARFDSRGGGRQEPDAKDLKTYLQLDYENEVTGNFNRRVVSFHDRVKVIYGPVASWNEMLRPNGKLRENDVLLNCEELTVAQGPVEPRTNRRQEETTPLELIAQGNAYVEGQTFTARGQRISFDQTKGQLVLEGAGNTEAVLSHQARVGARRGETRARKILYWPENQRIEVESASYADFGF